MDISLGDIVQMRKPHPCGSLTWEITRTGADVKLRCQGCGHVVMLDRVVFEKRAKKIVGHVETKEQPLFSEGSDGE